jgi:methylenetetrahydrofolate dehydrogenase (NADP+) / methenyltetrahydrofolate cyclohydrolase
MASAPSSSDDPSARIIDGRAVAAEITARVGEETRRLKAESGIVPGLAVVLVGNDPASQIYVGSKGRKAEELGFHSVQHTLPADAAEADVLAVVESLNLDPAINGILVQLPLPDQVDTGKVIEAVRPDKDVDGFHPVNVGRLVTGSAAAMVPCTPAGCLVLIRRAVGTSLAGLEALVVGRSNIVGKPMAQLLLKESCTVTVAHSRTRSLADTVRRADIVVAAVGRPEMIRGDWIKPGATVVDVGMNRIPAPEKGAGKTRLVGDVAFTEASRVAGAITPVPGGVGPMTIAMLMANTLAAACRQHGRTPPDVTA